MTTRPQALPTSASVILYQTEDCRTRLGVALRGETVRLCLNQLGELV